MTLTPAQLRRAASAATTLAKRELSECFDPARPGSRASPPQEAVLSDIGKVQYRWVVAANQAGKSAMVSRELGWILNGNHPTWTRPLEWGTGPLLIIIAGQDKKMMEVELWNNKLQQFLDPDDWREVRAGQQIQFVEHRRTGDRIVFVSHTDSSEKNRKHMQGYVAHYVWLDEMPSSTRILEELQRRVDSRKGYFIATFTPKFRNVQIRKVVDSAVEPLAKRYRLTKFDNPLFSSPEARETELAKLIGYSESMRAAVLHGEWMDSDALVHEFIPDLHGGTPEGYSPGWRHVAVADPATESKLGLTVWAEEPWWTDLHTGLPAARPELDSSGRPPEHLVRKWWCVRSEYIAGIYVPTRIIQAVEERLAGLSVVERRADSHEAWFIRQAADMGIVWRPVEGKTSPGRKDTLIRTLQESLGSRIRIADACLQLVDEMQEYERDPETGQIKKASRFHLIDTAHYFVSSIPEPSIEYVYASWDDRVYHSHLLRERREEQAAARRRASPGRSLHEIHAPSKVPPPLPPVPTRRRRSQRRQYKLA